MQRRRVLVCALMPEFDRDAGSCRVADLIDFLRQSGWAVTFVSQHQKCERRYVEALQQRGVAVYLGASAHLPRLIDSGLFELALFGLWHIAEPFMPAIRRASPHTRIIVDSVDLHFLRRARRIFTERQGPPVAALDDSYGAELVREINTYDAADAVLTVSQKEADLVNDFLGRPAVAFPVPQSESLEPSTVALKDRKGILFVGCFRHSPNADAVEYLCRAILPLLDPKLLANHPVQIVGDGLSDDVRRLADGLPAVRMVGWVPSVVPYLARARVTVLPLRYGAGTKRKLLQALAVGTPAVSTTIGAEGFDLVNGTHALIADEPVAFAGAVANLLESDRLWQRLARRGRADIADVYRPERARELLLRVVERVLRAEPRLAAHGTAATRTAATDRLADYASLVVRVRDAVQRCVPSGATVAVVNKGDDALLKLQGLSGWHFPRARGGGYLGWHPKDTEDALEQVRAVVASGARYLVFPATAAWWLDHYAGLRRHLETRGREMFRDADTCVIYALDAVGQAGMALSEPRAARTSSLMVAPSPIETPPEIREPVRSAGDDPLRLIAFYLPQFHPIPENDAWWGKGFTEWTNVTRAKPLFPGHDQPRMPADLGFYDLRLAEAREAQAELARAHGIHGFCHYHYWFEGKMLLERPFNDVLTTGRPDFPFCLCWANEPWSRRWDGQPRDVLQSQAYSLDDDRRHIEWLMPALADPRAITVEQKPVFLVYQARELPDPRRTTDLWRSAVERAGLKGLYLIAVETGWDAGWDATRVGFDAKVLFQPQFSLLRTVPRSKGAGTAGFEVYDYDEAWPILAKPEPVGYRRYNTVFPSWDNCARRGAAAVVVRNATPASYEAWLRDTIAQARRAEPDHQIVFVNAWNEWAEGAYLEPDVTHGRGFLEATARAIDASRPVGELQRGRRAAAVVVESLPPRKSARDGIRSGNGGITRSEQARILHAFGGRRGSSAADRGSGG